MFSLCQHDKTGRTADQVLRCLWKTSIKQIINAQTAPKEDFREILHSNLLKLYLIGVEEDPEFESLPVPRVAQKYQQFVEEIELLPNDLKPVYVMNVYGNLSTNRLSQILEIPAEAVVCLLYTSPSPRDS